MRRETHATILGLLLAGSAALSGCTAHRHPGAVILSTPEEDLPAHFDSRGIVILETFVNGHGPYAFLLDTGSEFNFMSREMAHLCRWSRNLFAYLDRAGDATGMEIEQFDPVHCDVLRVGGVEVRDLVCQTTWREALSQGHEIPIDGILGYHVFESGRLTLDYPRKKVSFGRGVPEPPDAPVTFPLAEPGVPDVVIRMGEESFTVTLDTAATMGIILGRRPEPETLASNVVAAKSAMSVAGRIEGLRQARVEGDVHLGSAVLERPMVTIVDGAGVIGLQILSNYRVVLDLAQGRFTLDGGPPRLKFGPIRGVGAYIRQVDGNWFVSEVLPGGPADSEGLRKGDRVLAVNGILPGDEAWSRTVQEYQRKEGAVLRISVRRGEKEITVDVPVVDLVP